MFCKIVNWILNPNKCFQMMTLDHHFNYREISFVFIVKYVLCSTVRKRDFLVEFYTEPKEAVIHW